MLLKHGPFFRALRKLRQKTPRGPASACVFSLPQGCGIGGAVGAAPGIRGGNSCGRRAQGGGADRRRKSGGERAAGRERVRNAPRREPPRGGQTEAERQSGEGKQFPARGGRLRDSGGDGRFSRNRRAFYPFFIPRTGENAVSEGGKIFFVRTVQSKVDFFHVA